MQKNQDIYDESLVSNSLNSVGKGALILFVGAVLNLFFQFVQRIIIARFFSPTYYGLFSLFFTILSISVAISLLGLTSGINRFIGYYRGLDEKTKINAVEKWGLIISFLSGIAFGILLFVLSPLIAPLFSENIEFVTYLRIAACTIPFYSLISALISIFRGHLQSREKIFFYDFGRNIIFSLFCIIIGIFSLPFIGIFFSMFLSTVIIAILFFIYYAKKGEYKIEGISILRSDLDVAKGMLMFSLPLLFVGILDSLLGWTDTILIGFFLTESDVGFYDAAKPLSILITTGLTVSAFIYGPLSASLYAKKNFKEESIIYSVLTKWICVITVPIAIILFFFSKEIITISFGLEYTPGSLPLKILTITFLIHTLIGPSGTTLTAYGSSKFLLLTTLFAVTLNIILNYFLIPAYGISGAAIATLISLVISSSLRSIKLYYISNVHSLKKDNLKPLILTLITGSIIAYALSNSFIPIIFQIVMSFFILTFLYIIMIVVTRSVTKQDILLLILLEKKIGINLYPLRKLLMRFMY